MKIAVECPGCGADVEIEPGRRSAELFCARCDYPLFWVTPPRSPEDDDDIGDMVLEVVVLEVVVLEVVVLGGTVVVVVGAAHDPLTSRFSPGPRVTSTVRSTGPRNTRRYSPGVGRSPSEYVPSSAGTACRRG